MRRYLAWTCVVVLVLAVASLCYAGAFCPNCGAAVQPDWKFCEKCGANLSQAGGGQAWLRPGTQPGQMIMGPDNARMVWVPPGELKYNRTTTVISKGFWLQQCEVTNKQYAQFLNEYTKGREMTPEQLDTLVDLDGTGWARIKRTEAGLYVAEPGWEMHPINIIKPAGAQAYAQHYEMRLPSEGEWEYAAMGAQGLEYPWGSEPNDRMACGPNNRGPMEPATMPVGSIREAASWCGALDLVGNVFECCSTGYYRGGSWENDCYVSARTSYDCYDSGFRCAISPLE
jgi:formylglycine-generating enzyme required for sulfatase activity